MAKSKLLMEKKNGFFIKHIKVDIMEDLMMKDGQKHILLQDGLVMDVLQLIMLIMIQNINIVQLKNAGMELEEKLQKNGIIHEEKIGFANTVNFHPKLLLILFKDKHIK